MAGQLTARNCLFLFVRSHQQLQQHCNVGETRQSANENGLELPDAGGSPRIDKVVEIHPLPLSSLVR